MRRRFSFLVALAVLGGAIAGCDHEEKPVVSNHLFDDKGNTALATNAASRLVVDRPAPTDGKATRVICSEPSPDVAMALSTALALTGSAKTPSGITASVGYNESTAEAITTLAGRTEAVVALRDGLFKACEAYSNGLIHKEAYALILSQYGDLLVTLMLGEAAATESQKGGSGSGSAASPGAGGASGGTGAAQPGITVAVGGPVTSTNPSATPSTASPLTQQTSKFKADLALLQQVLADLAAAQGEPADSKTKAADVSKRQAELLAAATNMAADSAASLGTEQATAQTKTPAATDAVSTIYGTYYANAPIRILQSMVVSCLEDDAKKDDAREQTPAANPDGTKAAVCSSLYKALSDKMVDLTAASMPANGTKPVPTQPGVGANNLPDAAPAPKK